MRRYTREELSDLAAGYALGAASPDEAVAIEQAIAELATAGESELATEIEGYREVAVRLAQARAVAPPPAIREQLMTHVRASKVVPITAAAPAATRPAAPAPSARSRVPRWLAAGLAASLVAAAGLAYQNASLRRTVDTGRDQLARVQEALTRREGTLDAVLEAEQQLYVARLVGTDTIGGPGIQLFWNARQGRAVLHAFRLPPAKAGRSYQLWLLRDGKPFSAKVFNSDADGHALVENLTLPENTTGVTQVLLTEEPEGGSPGPTSTPFLGGTLART